MDARRPACRRLAERCNDHAAPPRSDPGLRRGRLFTPDGARRARHARAAEDLRKDLLEPLVSEHQGRIVKLTGDGMLCEFASVVNAVPRRWRSSRPWRNTRRRRPRKSGSLPYRRQSRRRRLREDGDLYGDGVNIAARLEGIAEPGAVVVSGTAYDHLQGKLDGGFTPLGERRLKNIERPVRAYRVKPAPATRWLRRLLCPTNRRSRYCPSPI